MCLYLVFSTSEYTYNILIFKCLGQHRSVAAPLRTLLSDLKEGRVEQQSQSERWGLCQLTHCLGLGNGVVSFGMLPRSEQWGCVK